MKNPIVIAFIIHLFVQVLSSIHSFSSRLLYKINLVVVYFIIIVKGKIKITSMN